MTDLRRLGFEARVTCLPGELQSSLEKRRAVPRVIPVPEMVPDLPALPLHVRVLGEDSRQSCDRGESACGQYSTLQKFPAID
jgi:hypothetical protein